MGIKVTIIALSVVFIDFLYLFFTRNVEPTDLNTILLMVELWFVNAVYVAGSIYLLFEDD